MEADEKAGQVVEPDNEIQSLWAIVTGAVERIESKAVRMVQLARSPFVLDLESESIVVHCSVPWAIPERAARD